MNIRTLAGQLIGALELLRCIAEMGLKTLTDEMYKALGEFRGMVAVAYVAGFISWDARNQLIEGANLFTHGLITGSIK